MRLSSSLRCALAIAALSAPVVAARAQDELTPLTAYAPTLTFGTGLINAPVAWTSPNSGDIWASFSARGQNQGTLSPRPNGSIWDPTFTLDAHLFGRFSLGGSVYSSTNQQIGAHASLLLYRQRPATRWLPSVALGVRNLGASARQDRYVTGTRRVIDALPAAQRADRGEVNGSPTVYGVATREIVRDQMSLGLTAGFGTGLFRNDGGLDTVYNKRGTLGSGLFFGSRLSMRWSANSVMSLMLENDGWDWNTGVSVTAGPLVIGLYLTEIEETKGIPDTEPLANWSKTNLMIGYNGSLPEILSGSRHRAEAVELELERRRLQREVAQREARMAELNAQLARARQRADAEALAQRSALEKALLQEQEAAKRAADRLQLVKPGTKPPEFL